MAAIGRQLNAKHKLVAQLISARNGLIARLENTPPEKLTDEQLLGLARRRTADLRVFVRLVRGQFRNGTRKSDRSGYSAAIGHCRDFVLAWSAGRPLHISFDIDFLDPAYAPGTEIPSAGGLTTRQALRRIEAELRSADVPADEG